jgi:TPR repeat protein
MFMRARALKLLETGLISITLAAAVLAAEPEVKVPEDKVSEGKVDDSLAFPRQLDPDEALAKGRELRQRVAQGDAQAAFDFAVMLTKYGRFGPEADASTVGEWTKLANDRSALDWVMLAAEAGNQDAIAAVCRMAQDFLAPAHLQEKGKARCEQLRHKYPAK